MGILVSEVVARLAQLDRAGLEAARESRQSDVTTRQCLADARGRSNGSEQSAKGVGGCYVEPDGEDVADRLQLGRRRLHQAQAAHLSTPNAPAVSARKSAEVG